VLASSLNLFFERFSSPLPVFFSKFLHDFLMTINIAKGGQRLLLAMESGPTEDQDRRSEVMTDTFTSSLVPLASCAFAMHCFVLMICM
jgi:hypothetical protein